MRSQNIFEKLHEIFGGIWWVFAKIFNPLVTPVFAVLNYFTLEKVMKGGSWYRNLFLILSIIYFLATLILACCLIYKNIKEPSN